MSRHETLIYTTTTHGFLVTVAVLAVDSVLKAVSVVGDDRPVT